jgi:hypothetical protein
MKKMLLYLFLILLAGFIIEIFTTLNLSPKLLFNASKYRQFPELSDDLKWDGFSMSRATQNYRDDIRYFPEANFFMILSAKKAGHFNPIKIDSLGNKVFELDFPEKNAFNLLESINCFVIGADSIYDFSDNNPVAVPFTEVLNIDRNIPHKEWVEDIFGKLYNASDIVLYSMYTDIMGAFVVYFHHQGKWTKLYTPNKYPHFLYPSGTEIKCKINKEDIPHKWHEEHYLKDQNVTYSNSHRYTDSYITPYNGDSLFFPDQMLEYPPAGKLKSLAFAKETYTSDGYSNPGIPSEFYGTGYYALEIGNSVLNFKTVASKGSFGGKVDTFLHLFGLPSQYLHRSSVCFLTYDYSTNIHENHKKGTYVIRKTKL